MLLIDVSKIPDEGTDIDTAFSGAEAHVEGENMLKFESGHLRAHVDLDDEGTVHVKGHLDVRLGLECGRCLEPIALVLDQGLDLFLLPHSASAGEDEEDEVELSERDLV